jgi:hypothetical protein
VVVQKEFLFSARSDLADDDGLSSVAELLKIVNVGWCGEISNEAHEFESAWIGYFGERLMRVTPEEWRKMRINETVRDVKLSIKRSNNRKEIPKRRELISRCENILFLLSVYSFMIQHSGE